jgi:hypothetical protein
MLQSSEGIIASNQFYFVSLSAIQRGVRVGYGDRFLLPPKGHGILIAQCANTHRTNSAPPCETNSTFHTSGHWANVKNRYLGFEFPINGKTHYAWARLSVEVSREPFKATAILTGYAYETVPGKAIIAGQTKGPEDDSIQEPNASLTAPTPRSATLGMLALGAPALSIWRREENPSLISSH